jgi:lysozyme family protein
MANFEEYYPKLLEIEGGYVNNPNDAGGATKYGITLAIWKAYGRDLDRDGIITQNDIKLITPADAKPIAKKRFWDVVRGDEIINQAIAEEFVDWCFNSGFYYPTLHLQKLLGLDADGRFGSQTLYQMNHYPDQEKLFDMLKAVRMNYVHGLAESNPKNKNFLDGWLARIKQFIFKKNA